MVAPTIFTKLFDEIEDGIPSKLKNTRRFDYGSAIGTWKKLLSNYWKFIMLINYST
tara:strand:- start:979 stop:1146 length:168 start_codon:yes stop_codon:yes gene_type:complete